MSEQSCCHRHHQGLQHHHRSVSSSRMQRQLPEPPARGATSPSPSSISSIPTESDTYGRVFIHKNPPHRQPDSNKMFVPIKTDYSIPIDNRNPDQPVMFGVKYLGQGRGKQGQRSNGTQDSVIETVSDSGISDGCLDSSPQSCSSEEHDYASIPFKMRKIQNTQRNDDILPV